MQNFSKAVTYLMNQKKWTLWLVGAIALLFPIADLETALISPMISKSRIPLAMLVSLVITACITFPTLLYISRTTGRLRELFGYGRTSVFSAVALFGMFYLDSGSKYDSAFVTVPYAILTIYYAIILSGILLVVKGKAPYFPIEENKVTASS